LGERQCVVNNRPRGYDEGWQARMKWSLRSRILAGYALILLLLLFILLFSLINLQRLGKASASILQENYKSIIAAEFMTGAIERQDSALLLILLGYVEEGAAQFRQNTAEFLQWLGRAKDNVTIAGEGELVAGIESSYLEYLRVSESLLAGTVQARGQAGHYYHETALPLFVRIRSACQELRELNQGTMYESSDRARQVAGRTTVSLLGIGAAVLLFGLLFSFFLSNLIVRPLARVIDGMRAIEKGDFDVQLYSASRDELGRLANDFNNMVRQLKRYRELNIGEIMAEKKKIETIIQTIDDGIVVLDTEARVTDLNAKATEILKVKAADFKGEHFLELLGSEEIFRHLKKVLAEGKSLPAGGEEKTLTIENGEDRRHYQYFISPIRLKPGRVQGAVLLLRDVTRLKELNQLKSEFIMKASHELKNPLTGLTMNISLLQESASSSLKEGDRQLLASAKEDLKRLRTMVDDLLDLSRIEAGKLPMEIVETSLPLIVENALDAMRSQAEELSIAVSADLAPALPTVLADANKVLWVLTNLVANALRYTPRGGFVRIVAEKADTFVRIDIRDNGRGIPYEDQPRIFEKFFQVKDEPGTRGSLGIGLAICKEIIRAHRGSIWVDSTPGQGSTFSFTLPCAPQG
jgi:NtrC-family two-component system sensor histidine kinase KinB